MKTNHDTVVRAAVADIWKRDIAELKRTKQPGWELVCEALEEAWYEMLYPDSLHPADIKEIFEIATGEPSPACSGKNRKRREEERFMQADAFASGLVLGEGNVDFSSTSVERFCEIMAILGYEVPASRMSKLMAEVAAQDELDERILCALLGDSLLTC